MKYASYGILLTYSILASSTAIANTKPTIEGTPTTTILPGENYHFQPIANDADGDTLSFSLKKNLHGLNLMSKLAH